MRRGKDVSSFIYFISLLPCILRAPYNNLFVHKFFSWPYLPASVAQLDVLPTGDQEVTGSTLPRSATFFRGD